MTDKAESSALQRLLETVEKEIHLRRRDIEGQLTPVEAALTAYRRALEERAAHDFASSHGIKRTSGAGVSPQQAARNLLQAVRHLPELQDTSASPSLSIDPSETPQDRAVWGETKRAAPESRVAPLSSALPAVAQACDSKKLVIVGALAGRRRTLPDPLEYSTEWIDTGDGGAHALGNAPTRVRQGRFFAVIICEQAISHQHSEPLMAAARAANIPVGFAGKGGGAGIGRALKGIEQQLSAAKP